MTKANTIDAIRALNPTAAPEFLAEFSPDDLVRYLNRLNHTARTPSFGGGEDVATCESEAERAGAWRDAEPVASVE